MDRCPGGQRHIFNYQDKSTYIARKHKETDTCSNGFRFPQSILDVSIPMRATITFLVAISAVFQLANVDTIVFADTGHQLCRKVS